MKAIHQDILHGADFKLGDENPAEDTATRIKFYTLVKRIATAEGKAQENEEHGEGVRSQILKSTRAPGASMITKLKVTVNDLKPPGEVGVRVLLAAPNHSWRGLACWLAWRLQPKITALKHLMWTTHQATDEMRKLDTIQNEKIIKVDIKHFFMSGETWQLVGSLRAL